MKGPNKSLNIKIVLGTLYLWFYVKSGHFGIAIVLTLCPLMAVGTSFPSLYQEISGWGFPSASHRRVTGSFFATIMSSGCSMITGAPHSTEMEWK